MPHVVARLSIGFAGRAGAPIDRVRINGCSPIPQRNGRVDRVFSALRPKRDRLANESSCERSHDANTVVSLTERLRHWRHCRGPFVSFCYPGYDPASRESTPTGAKISRAPFVTPPRLLLKPHRRKSRTLCTRCRGKCGPATPRTR